MTIILDLPLTKIIPLAYDALVIGIYAKSVMCLVRNEERATLWFAVGTGVLLIGDVLLAAFSGAGMSGYHTCINAHLHYEYDTTSMCGDPFDLSYHYIKPVAWIYDAIGGFNTFIKNAIQVRLS